MSAEGGTDPTALARLALDLHRQPDVSAVLERVLHAAVQQVPGTRWAGVTLIDRDGVRLTEASAPVVDALESLQHVLNEGPGLAAARESELVVSADLADDQRWPTFGGRAREYGVRSMVSVRMSSEHGSAAVLSLYSDEPMSFDAGSKASVLPLAIHAGNALVSVSAKANLRTALGSRDLIGQAKGILMERHKISADDAFTLLTRVSQSRHRKLKDVAEHLADTGELLGHTSRPAGPQTADRDGSAKGHATETD